jgi:hypothetical protein
MSKFKIGKKIYYLDRYSIFGYSKYFSEFEIYDEIEFINHKICALIDLIGEHNAEDISGKNSFRHKGIKKIKKECETEYKVLLTNSEIKSLLTSKTRNNIFGNQKRCIKCPYTMDFILLTIIKLSANNKKIKEEFNNKFSNLEINNLEQNCYSLLLSKYYASLKQKLQNINRTTDKDGKKEYFESIETKLLRLKNSLNSSFTNKCQLLN